MLTIRAMSGGAGYAQRHLEHSDYYDEHRRVQGEWHGRGAELLGLRGEVAQKQFEAVREGLHPDTGEFLRPRHSADRIGNDGSEQSKGRSLYDLTFSAPKSVSIQALVGGDERLVAAHDKAVRETLAEAESHSATRVRLNSANEDRTTANWIVATYRHDTSRELDPQLHTHAFTTVHDNVSVLPNAKDAFLLDTIFPYPDKQIVSGNIFKAKDPTGDLAVGDFDGD